MSLQLLQYLVRESVQTTRLENPIKTKEALTSCATANFLEK